MSEWHVGPELEHALTRIETDAAVFQPGVPSTWSDAEDILTDAFRLTKTAVIDGRPVVYVVAFDDLLGRNGSLRAAIACGLLSGARTAAVETARAGVPINVLAVTDQDPASIASWVSRLAEPDGPTGELVTLGPAHLGKALP